MSEVLLQLTTATIAACVGIAFIRRMTVRRQQLQDRKLDPRLNKAFGGDVGTQENRLEDAQQSEPLSSLPDVAGRIARSFPASLSTEVGSALRAMPSIYMRERTVHDPGKTPFFPAAARLSESCDKVKIDDEVMEIPHRIIVSEPPTQAIDHLTDRERIVLACIYTRHVDGFVRERYLKLLLSVDFPWIAPFVIPAIGEYVLEIVQLIFANIDRLRSQHYARFVEANPAFMQKIRRQVISYWAYDSGYKNFKDYPGYKTLSQLGWWRGREGRWLLRRRSRQ